MKTYYEITEAIYNHLSNNNITKTVTIGDITEVDLNRRTIFPLAHIIVNAGNITPQVINLQLSVLFMDLVDYSDTQTKDQQQPFYGNNNLQDVHNTQLAAANLLGQSMMRGDLWDNYFHTDSVDVEPFQDRFENTLAGWSLNVSVNIRNTDISVC